MEGLYPIIRRKRRPLVNVGDAVKRAAEKVVAKQHNETAERSRTSDNDDGVKNEKTSTTERTRPTVVG